jgi:lysophospholipase L1-like esterase
MRVLYLGDSVTFGYMLSRYEQTFPFLAGRRLEERLKMPVETVNAGVDGYSPWQEHRFLVREGIRYHPDLVVVGFVLNDVTEKLELARFGGWSEGPQLARTVSGSLERVLKRSSLLQFGGRLLARMRFGADVRSGALKKELLDVESLASHPDRPDVQRAWQGALADLGDIFSFCRDERVSVIVVVFPYTFQFADPVALRAPQEMVMRLARDEKVPALDLLPALAERMKETGQGPGDYFLDINHLSPQGSKVVSELLADFIGRVIEAGGKNLRGES